MSGDDDAPRTNREHPVPASGPEPGLPYGVTVDPFTDDELSALALAADPDAPIPDDAVPFRQPAVGEALLPEWYMPVPGSFRRTRPRVIAVAAIIGSLLLVNGAGLCVTYGWPEIAW
jgi:hypothetical protein